MILLPEPGAQHGGRPHGLGDGDGPDAGAAGQGGVSQGSGQSSGVSCVCWVSLHLLTKRD